MFATVFLFLMAYSLNMFFITVLYHRGFSHHAFQLSPKTRARTAKWGIWITGMDPKVWACVHRIHHQHADTPHDPHTPRKYGMFIGLIAQQFRSYRDIARKLASGNKEYTKLVRDLDFDVHWVSRRELFFLPYLFQGLLAVLIIFISKEPLLGLAYYLGVMSHPIQGWLVNAFGHRVGYRNFETKDESRNNFWVALFIFGEGLQNNHHRYPSRANMAMQWWEPDLGYLFCKLGYRLGWIQKL